MQRAQRRQWWLLAGVAVLVAVTGWQWHSQRTHATLLPLDPASITRVDVTWQGHPTRHYIKHDDHWYRAGQPARHANDARLAHLAALAATPVLSWRKVAGMDLDKIGLATPPVTVRLDGHTLAYGTLTAFGPQRFVRVGRRIAIIPASYSPRAPARPVSPGSVTASPSSQKS